MHIDKLFPLELLEEELRAGYVRARRHPELPLTIYNYSQHAQFERRWNEITRSCRGLIVNDDGKVVARPWKKFFNHGEFGQESFPGRGPIQVLEKLDGSLGILYPVGDDFRVATRGSFTSEQALHGTRLWQEQYAQHAALDPALTYLVEIIYPQNRVVVDYGSIDDLVLIGAVDTESGRSIDIGEVPGWPGPRAQTFDFNDINHVLNAPARDNAEGFVVWFRDTDERLKIKYSGYLRLHRLLTDVSERRVWEVLSLKEDPLLWLEGVPDEFYTFVTGCIDTLNDRYGDIMREFEDRYQRIISELEDGYSRADFAHKVSQQGNYPLAKSLFARHDGKDYSRAVWALLKPAEHKPFHEMSREAD